MDQSIFMDKAIQPDDEALKRVLDTTYIFWNEITDFVVAKYPAAIKEWSYSGKNYGWNFRLKDKKRAIIYLLPRNGFFKVAFVFGQKATDQVMISEVSEPIKSELLTARVYAEGRGVRIDVAGDTPISDIKKLVEIKLSH